MDNPLLLMLLILAIAVMGGFYYFKRAQHRGDDVAGHDAPRNDDADVR